MIVLGLTGSIATGKSFVADYLRRRGIAVFDADMEVHELLNQQAVQAEIAQQFPAVVKAGRTDRNLLGRIVFGDAEKRKALEAIMHPRIRDAESRFIESFRKKEGVLIVLEIPLLYETGAENLCDKVMVTIATPKAQEERVLQRPGMTAEKFRQILKTQMSDAAKKKKADYVVDTSGDEESVHKQVDKILRELGVEI